MSEEGKEEVKKEKVPYYVTGSPTMILTKSFARFSAGTKFKVKAQTGGSISHCETMYPIKNPDTDKMEYVKADIPSKYLVKARGSR